jgi:hypothetical protein
MNNAQWKSQEQPGIVAQMPTPLLFDLHSLRVLGGAQPPKQGLTPELNGGNLVVNYKVARGF